MYQTIHSLSFDDTFYIKEDYSLKTDIIFSINIGYNIDFLFYQLENFKKFIMVDYLIIINTNKELYDKLVEKTKDIHNIIINPILIEKKRFHGSIFHGIYENIKYCFEKNISFQYFIILSNKTIFYKQVDSKNYHQLRDIDEKKRYGTKLKYNQCIGYWWWPQLHKTLLSQYIQKNNLYFSYGAHEGLGFTYNTLKSIYLFLEKNRRIRQNLFHINSCVEEFALQSICVSLDKKYFNIGNGTGYLENPDPNKFIYKVRHEDVLK